MGDTDARPSALTASGRGLFSALFGCFSRRIKEHDVDAGGNKPDPAGGAAFTSSGVSGGDGAIFTAGTNAGQLPELVGGGATTPAAVGAAALATSSSDKKAQAVTTADNDGAAKERGGAEDNCGAAAPSPTSGGTGMSDLTEDLVAEILLLVPPEFLPRYGRRRVDLVCKSWRRIISDPGFRRRYFHLHRQALISSIIFTHIS
jgi:hypothetical protein